MERADQAYNADLDWVRDEAQRVQGMRDADKLVLQQVVDVIVREIGLLDGEVNPAHKETRDEVLACNSRTLRKMVPRVQALISLGEACREHDYSASLRILTWNLISNWGAGLAPDAGGFQDVSRDKMCMLNRVFQQAFMIGKSGASVVGVVELDYESILTCLLGLLGYRKLAFAEKLRSPGLNVRENLQLNEARPDGAALYAHSSIFVRDVNPLEQPYLVLERNAEPFHGVEYDFKPEYLVNGKPRVEEQAGGPVPTGTSEVEFVKVPSKAFRQVPVIVKLRLAHPAVQNRDIVFALTHLTANKHWGGEADRIEQFQELVERALALAQNETTPVIFMGDFNADNQNIEVKGIKDSFYEPRLFREISLRSDFLCHPQLDSEGRVQRVTCYKTRTVKGVKQTYNYTPARIMGHGIQLYLDAGVLMGLTKLRNPADALAIRLKMPTALMPSDHEPVLVSTAAENPIDMDFWMFPPHID
jgi:hypothetical protein